MNNNNNIENRINVAANENVAVAEEAVQANREMKVIERTRRWLNVVNEKEVIIQLAIFTVVYSVLNGDKCISALFVTFFILHAKKYLL